MYYIPFKSYWSAYLNNVVSTYEGCCHFERNSFKTQKKTLKMCQLPNRVRYTPRLYLILKLFVHNLMWHLSFIPFVFQKRSWKIVGVVNHILDWRGSQFYEFNQQTFTRQFLWEKFVEIRQIYSQTELWDCVSIINYWHSYLGFKGLIIIIGSYLWSIRRMLR